MSFFLETFNNREIAIFIWVIAFLSWAFTNANVREAAKSVIKTFFSKTILRVVGSMLLYIISIVLFFNKIELWNLTNLKDTIYWCITVAFSLIFRIHKIDDINTFFRNIIVDQAKLIVLLEYVTNLYTFSLPIELITTPVMIFLMMLLGVSQTDSKHKLVENILKYLLGIIGYTVVGYTVYMIVKDFSNFTSMGHVSSILLPPVMTISFLPFVYFLALHLIYDSLFIRISHFTKDKSLVKYANRRIVIAFHLNLLKLHRFSRGIGIPNFFDKEEVESKIKMHK